MEWKGKSVFNPVMGRRQLVPKQQGARMVFKCNKARNYKEEIYSASFAVSLTPSGV
jgi:hypothetical protein